MELWSFDTICNSFADLAMHVLPRNFTTIYIVTSDFHLPRTHASFQTILALAEKNIILSYTQTPSGGLTPEEVESRLRRELLSLEYFNGKTKPRLKNMEELHKFIF
jgi:hypothetical protein